MKSKKQPKSKLIRLPVRITESLDLMRLNPKLCPTDSRPSYKAVISSLIEYYQTNEPNNLLGVSNSKKTSNHEN